MTLCFSPHYILVGTGILYLENVTWIIGKFEASACVVSVSVSYLPYVRRTVSTCGIFCSFKQIFPVRALATVTATIKVVQYATSNWQI